MFQLILLLIIFVIETKQEPVNWEEAKPGEFPFMVWLANKVRTDKEKATCVGSLISNTWVLVDSICGQPFNLMNDVVIPVESGVIPDRQNGLKVVEKITHEGYRTYYSPSDGYHLAEANSLTLLKLATPVDLQQGFAPVLLASQPLLQPTNVVKPTWIQNESVVKYHTTKLYPWETCKTEYGRYDPFFQRAEGMICAEKRDPDTPTSGPFIERGSSPTDTVLIGFLTKDNSVKGGKVYIATDVGKYRQWIKQKTGI